jgi:MFS family permease
MTMTNSPDDNRYRWIIIIIATWAQISATFVTYGVGPLASIWQQELHLNSFQVGMVLSAVNIGPLFSMILVGRLLDQYGEKWIVFIGSVLLGFTFLCVTLTSNYLFLVLLLGIVGLWYGTSQPGGSKVVIRWFDEKERGLAMGIRQAGIPIGGALGGFIIPLVYEQTGWESAIVIQAVTAILGGIIFFLLYREPKESFSNHSKKSQYKMKEKLSEILRNKKALPIFLVGIVLISVQMTIVGHLMTYLINHFTLSVVTAGQILSASLIAGTLGRVLLGWMSDAFWSGNRSDPLLLSVLSCLVFISIMIFLPANISVWILFFICMLLGFFGIGWFSTFLVAVAEHSPRNAEGLMVSFALTLNQVAIVLAPSVFGFIVDQWSFTIAWLTIDLMLVLMAVYLLVMKFQNRQVK